MSIDPHSTKSKISRLYNKVASLYDQVGPQTHAQFGNILVEDADLSPGWRVLDVATGRGAVLIPATNQLSKDGMAVGVDLAFGMLQLTKAACQAKAMLRAAVCLMDGEELAFPASSFDAVLCGFAIFFMDLRKTLPEWWRALRPGGLVAVSLAFENDPRWDWYEELLRDYQKKYGFSLSLRSGEVNRPPEVMEALRSNHFERVDLRKHELEIKYPDMDTWWQSRWTHGSRYPLDQMPADVLRSFKNEVFENLQGMQRLVEIRRLACVIARKPLI